MKINNNNNINNNYNKIQEKVKNNHQIIKCNNNNKLKNLGKLSKKCN